MPEDYIVKPGDCLSSIAFEHGFLWETIWNDPANGDLKKKRADPNVLMAGDVVVIPGKKPKTLSLPTGKRHKIVVKRAMAMLRLRIVEPTPAPPETAPTAPAGGGGAGLLGAVSAAIGGAADAIKSAASSLAGGGSGKDVSTEDPPYQPVQVKLAPRANLPYHLVVDGGEGITGNTDGDGNVVQPIAPNARSATLILEPGTPHERTIEVKLGALDPADGVAGAKQRLANLGYACGDRSDEVTPDFARAVKSFQSRHGLSETGELDGATSAKLRDLHGT